jgi:hypothetical protein
MSMLTTVLIKLGLALFSALPIERVLAILLSRWLDKIDISNADKAAKTAEHLAELAALFADILADKQITEAELVQTRDFVVKLREELLLIWANGKTAKSLQYTLASNGVSRPYADSYHRGGYATRGVLGLVLCVCVLCAGCLTRTRCQEINAEAVYVTINVNDAETLAENAYPRSLTILSQDQMIEGGADSIASGNDPSLNVPLGDSALGAVGAMIGGAVKGYTAAPAKTADAVDAACVDGDCSD